MRHRPGRRVRGLHRRDRVPPRRRRPGRRDLRHRADRGARAAAEALRQPGRPGLRRRRRRPGRGRALLRVGARVRLVGRVARLPAGRRPGRAGRPDPVGAGAAGRRCPAVPRLPGRSGARGGPAHPATRPGPPPPRRRWPSSTSTRTSWFAASTRPRSPCRCGLPRRRAACAWPSQRRRRPRVAVAAAPAVREARRRRRCWCCPSTTGPAYAPWLHEALFDDLTNRAAFRALDEADGALVAGPRARRAGRGATCSQRLVVEEPADDPAQEVFHLIRLAALPRGGRPASGRRRRRAARPSPPRAASGRPRSRAGRGSAVARVARDPTGGARVSDPSPNSATVGCCSRQMPGRGSSPRAGLGGQSTPTTSSTC